MQAALELPTDAERKKAYYEATQQSIPRKLEEMKLAIGLAKKYTKKQILTAYLNIAYFGDQTYGVQAAAQHYFNKNATDLTPQEAASILAIVQSPNTRNLSDPKLYDGNQSRRDVILKSMYAEKDLTKEQYDAAIASKPADYVHLTQPTQGCKASVGDGSQFFCDYAVQVIKSMDQLGATTKERATAWRNGGYQIQTTLNIDLNAEQKALLNQYDPKTETRFALGATMNSIEAGTGHILTMAQNKDYDQSPNSPTTATGINYSADYKYGGSSGFQTGSTYKLFTLLDWLQNGHGLYEQTNGTPRTISPWQSCGQTDYTQFPVSNDTAGERGNYSVLSATEGSINASFASMAQKLDLCDIRDTAKSLGVHRADGNELKYNPSSVLGINELAPMTMAAAYAAISNNGVYCAPIAIVNITSPSGKSLGGQPKDCKQVIDQGVVATAVYALKGVIRSGTAVGAQTPDGAQLFGKTGTTDDADQIWLVGGSTKVATAYWQGNTDGKKFNLRHYYPNAGLGSYASQRAGVWRQAMTAVNQRYAPGAFNAPTSQQLRGSNTVSVPDVSGKTADQARAQLSQSGFTYVDGGTQPGGGAAGTVSSTSPAGGSLLSKGSSVTVYTSDGSQATIPNVANKSAGDARAALSDSGFTNVQVADQFEKGDDKNACTVAATDPAGGTAASKSAQVTVKLYGTKDGKDPGNCK
jgi:membrane peptidoglycan carboxypeptidase